MLLNWVITQYIYGCRQNSVTVAAVVSGSAAVTVETTAIWWTALAQMWRIAISFDKSFYLTVHARNVTMMASPDHQSNQATLWMPNTNCSMISATSSDGNSFCGTKNLISSPMQPSSTFRCHWSTCVDSFPMRQQSNCSKSLWQLLCLDVESVT